MTSETRPARPTITVPPWCLGELPPRSPRLEKRPLRELTGELLGRLLESGGPKDNSEASHLYELATTLEQLIDVHCNRFSRQRYFDLFHGTYGMLGDDAFDLRGSTVVDLGCGSWNPGGFSFLYLLLGAKRAYAVDMDPPENTPRAIKVLADLAAILLVNPRSIVGGHEITRAEILDNLEGFDLAKLAEGDQAGIDSDRLRNGQWGAEDLPLADGEADLLCSNAFFEHVVSFEEVLDELARVTRPGGFNVHVIDASDHRRYNDPARHPLDYLREPGDEVVHLKFEQRVFYHMNRLRPREWVRKFEERGFEVLLYRPFKFAEVTEAMRSKFVEPYRSMELDALSEFMAQYVIRRR